MKDYARPTRGAGTSGPKKPNPKGRSQYGAGGSK